MSLTKAYRRVNPKTLKNHPLSHAIYGDVIDDDMLASMKTLGQLEPIVVAADGAQIISGHRRRQGAIKLGWKEVDVLVRSDLTDPLAIEEAVIHANRQREKTVEQRAREFKRLVEIEAEKAEKRMKQGVKADPREKLPRVGKSTDIAADAVGMSAPTAKKAAAVVDAIDKAKEADDEEFAEELRETLNTESVTEAFKKATGKVLRVKKDAVPKHLQPAFGAAKKLKGALASLGKVANAVEALADGKGGELLHKGQFKVAMKDAQAAVRAAIPYAVCVECDGKGCDSASQKKRKRVSCDGKGWLTREQLAGVTK